MNDTTHDDVAIEDRARTALELYNAKARPFIETNAPESLGQLDSDSARLSKLLEHRKPITACFLGHSGIGKSTLLNALADGRRQVLPAGGIGPLTAKATEVHFSEIPTFIATYQPRGRLRRLIFALEQRLKHTLGTLPDDEVPELEELERQEVMSEVAPPASTDDEPVPDDPVDAYIKQAKQLVTGDQFSERRLEYLIDSLRVACDLSPLWELVIDPPDQIRVRQIQQVLALAAESKPHERRQHDSDRQFPEDLKAHTAGFLAPLISTIYVGWPSELLKSGVVLVDLPGIGIAQDAYRHVTKKYVRDEARAVVLVVDRSGPTEDTVNLLRTSGYWDRLVGASDDPDSDACKLLIAVTKVDDVANEEWINIDKSKRKREVFADLVAGFKTRMRTQILDGLKKIGTTNNQAVDEARELAREKILQTLEIHPVSAPEYRKLLLRDDDDPPFLKEESETGIPALSDALATLAISDKLDRQQQMQEVVKRFADSILSAIKLVHSRWEEKTHASAEAERVAAKLDTFSAPKRKEYDLRVGGFREYLQATVQSQIHGLVLEARAVAEEEVRKYLKGLRGAHWATLRAAVRRGGTFFGSRQIDLPVDIADRFQEPMAAVWSQRLLKDIRKRTSELALDVSNIVEEICDWAHKNAGTMVRTSLLKDQSERIKGRVEVMRQVGKEAVDELRQVVKQKLAEAI